MSYLVDVIGKEDVQKLKNARKKALKPIIGELLFDNLRERLEKINTIPTMKGGRMVSIKLDKRGAYLTVRPYVHNNRLIFEVLKGNIGFNNARIPLNMKGVRIEASDIYGEGINRVDLSDYR